MDIAATSLFVQQQAYGQLQTGNAMIKQAAKQEQQTAAILAQAVEAASNPGSTRGTQLDITV